jgi:hypothetical protein
VDLVFRSLRRVVKAMLRCGMILRLNSIVSVILGLKMAIN